MQELTFRGTSVRIDTQNGAAVTYFSCTKGETTFAPINNRGYNSFEGSLLFPFPNRLADGHFTFEGNEYQFDHNDFGRPNALHGLVYNQPFSVQEKSENSLRVSYESSGEEKAFPFAYRLEITYQLNKNELTIDVKVINEDTRNMPCGFGWHPYFDLTQTEEACRLKIPKVSKVEVDENMIPTGERNLYKDFQEFTSIQGRQLDTCFSLERVEERNSVFLTYPDFGSLEIWQNMNCPFIQIFKYDERSIAIEPMTCGIDAFHTGEGLKILSPQEMWAFNMGLKLY
ncbi:aldose 1-epimerase [Roseivirga sp.]|uniref:aldose 1-epimerase n=1 Tax=Roseivirga sp. TaxID=1964215 RepID=UPI003B51834F